MEIDYKQLMHKNIGEIRNMEKVRDSMSDIIDRQKETVTSYLEQNKVDEDWAENFLKEMEINDN